jgi:hypothetical protein
LIFHCLCEICFAAIKKAKATFVLNAKAMKRFYRSVAVAPCMLWTVSQ